MAPGAGGRQRTRAARAQPRSGRQAVTVLSHLRPKERLDFKAINRAALRVLPDLMARWVPGGKVQGREWTGRNPKRADRNPGSFKLNLATGRWADFASGDKGGDVTSLAAYLHGLSQVEAARRLAEMLGLTGGGHG